METRRGDVEAEGVRSKIAERWGQSWQDKTEDVGNDGASGGSCLSRQKDAGLDVVDKKQWSGSDTMRMMDKLWWTRWLWMHGGNEWWTRNGRGVSCK